MAKLFDGFTELALRHVLARDLVPGNPVRVGRELERENVVAPAGVALAGRSGVVVVDGLDFAAAGVAPQRATCLRQWPAVQLGQERFDVDHGAGALGAQRVRRHLAGGVAFVYLVHFQSALLGDADGIADVVHGAVDDLRFVRCVLDAGQDAGQAGKFLEFVAERAGVAGFFGGCRHECGDSFREFRQLVGWSQSWPAPADLPSGEGMVAADTGP